MSEVILGDFFNNRQEPGQPGLPVMSVTMNDGRVPRDDLDRRMASALKPEQHLLVRKGDIAYNMMRMWQGAYGLATEDGIVSPAYVVLSPKAGIDSRFAYHWFKSARMIHYFWAYSHGLTEDRLRLYFDAFSEIPVSLPSLQRQRRIVALLDVWDRAIDKIERLVEAKRRHWLLLIHSMKSIKWEAVALGNLGQWVGGGTPSKSNSSYWKNGSIPWISPKDMTSWKISSSIDSITKEAVFNSSTQIIPPGSVLVVTRSDILRTRVPIGLTTCECAINQDIKALVPKDKGLAPLIATMLLAAGEELRQNCVKVGTTVESIDVDELRRFKIAIPTSVSDISSVIRVLVGSLEEIDTMERQLDRVRTQKRALLQNLLTGEWPLDVRFDPSGVAPRSTRLDGGA